MRRLWGARGNAVLLGCLLLASASVVADPDECLEQSPVGSQGGLVPPPSCIPPDHPPENLGATFDTATEILTLTWDAPPDGAAPDSYIVYRDGSVLARTTSTTADDDLTGFSGQHAYWVTGVWGTHEGDSSLPLYVGKAGGLPSACPIASVTLYTSPLDVPAYSIHDECLPP